MLKYFFKHPTEENHIRGLAEKTGISYTSTRNALLELHREDLVKKREEKKMTFFAANFESERFRRLKRIFNLWVTYESGLVEEIERAFRPDAVVLFGSFLEGVDTEDSDVDLAIINGRSTSIDLKTYETLFNREIHLIQIEDPRKEKEEFKNTLANGLVLHGYLRIF